jgi:hypothetical protein
MQGWPPASSADFFRVEGDFFGFFGALKKGASTPNKSAARFF